MWSHGRSGSRTYGLQRGVSVRDALLGIYHKQVLPELTQRLADGRKEKLRIRDFLRDLDVVYVNAEALTDGVRKSTSCNTPEEWQRLMEQESIS